MKGLCAVCGRPTFDWYMVEVRVWVAAGLKPEDEFHIDCLSERLGRELTISDFDPEAPINRMLFFGYRMGRRPGESGDIPELPPIKALW